jgi:hypothetical protein
VSLASGTLPAAPGELERDPRIACADARNDPNFGVETELHSLTGKGVMA